MSLIRSAVTSRSNCAKREQDVQRQPAHRCCGVEGLRDRDEGHVIAVEHLDQFGKIGERSAEPVDLVDHDHVDQPVLDVFQQPLQAGPLQCAAGDAAIVILVTDQHPAFGPLGGDVGLAGLALGVERC